MEQPHEPNETPEPTGNPASKSRKRTIGLAITGVAIVVLAFAFLQSCIQNQDTAPETPSEIVEQLTDGIENQGIATPILAGDAPNLWLAQYPGTVYTIDDVIHLSFYEDPESGQLVLIYMEGNGLDLEDDQIYAMGFYIGRLLQIYAEDSTEAELIYSKLGMDDANFFTPTDEIYQTDTAAFVHTMEDGLFTFAIDFIY